MACHLVQRPDKKVGVVECWANKGCEFKPNDITFLSIFCSILNLYWNELRLTDILDHGRVQTEIDEFLKREERALFTVPEKLALTQPIDSLQFSPFDTPEVAFPLVFNTFEKFGLVSRFQLNNEKLFRLADDVRKCYNEEIPYHNWLKIVDMLQAVFWQVDKGKYISFLKPVNLLALILACMFAFAGHDGTSNDFQVKARTPAGILFQNDALTKVHCQKAIEVLTREKIFDGVLEGEDRSEFWEMVISLIENVDVEGPEKFIHELQQVLQTIGFDFRNNQRHIWLLLALLLKTAYVTSLCRPFATALKWQNAMMMEMFMFGDKEMKSHLNYSSPNNVRDHHHKEKVQIEYLQKYVIPLADVHVQISSGIRPVLEGARDNMKKWNARLT
jgi:hypothetical protein